MTAPVDFKDLAEALAPALADYRRAQDACEKSEGYITLCQRASQRLFQDRLVYETGVGGAVSSGKAPCAQASHSVLRQLGDSLGSLMKSACAAQLLLKQSFVPNSAAIDGGARRSVRDTWPPGETRSRPAVLPMCLEASPVMNTILYSGVLHHSERVAREA